MFHFLKDPCGRGAAATFLQTIFKQQVSVHEAALLWDGTRLGLTNITHPAAASGALCGTDEAALFYFNDLTCFGQDEGEKQRRAVVARTQLCQGKLYTLVLLLLVFMMFISLVLPDFCTDERSQNFSFHLIGKNAHAQIL